MPLIRGYKIKGLGYYKFGKHGHKYYYQTNNKKSRLKAKKMALKQARAIEWSKHKK